ncbi:MAG: ABC transporter ATP-binding protein [Bacteroidales bacterium]|nr:ABC transporter ATP-binding protein [Bacteroidales bacterium]MDD2264955.1 ABC transporter ATP-binding protein [Bacteroidales bacterium]MDD2832123.1 ABC transporter ATP-binding protein [Bacteroidales bacterium]MDD3208775.1 ABC transporter ATP-binding protein [Bacteroidales bacterium]MDD3697338.1 ABC transporter ATP-binding protein [Bacteroidales bacterium]
MGNKFAIETIDLKKTYKGKSHPTLDGLSLRIPYGSLFGLLAPNGAGKTTAINIICGLRKYDSGKVFIEGHDLSDGMKAIKPLLGLVPQDIALFPTLTAYENLKIFGGLYGIEKPLLEKRIDQLLELFDLSASRHSYINRFSGGMKRRVNMIAGMLHAPRILILDEPTVGVDAQSRIMILEKLIEINRSGTTILFISHYLEEAEHICTEVAFMDNGSVICQGPPADLIDAYKPCDSMESIYLTLTGKWMRDTQ